MQTAYGVLPHSGGLMCGGSERMLGAGDGVLLCALRSDVFGDYVGQLQMASIATNSVEAGGHEVSRQEVMAKLAPIQQVRPHVKWCVMHLTVKQGTVLLCR